MSFLSTIDDSDVIFFMQPDIHHYIVITGELSCVSIDRCIPQSFYFP